MSVEPFSANVKFPTLPSDRVPEDRIAIRTIVAGQRGLNTLYKRLDSSLSGDSLFLVRMLRRDWDERFQELLGEGKRLLRSLGVKSAAEILPSVDEIEKIAGDQSGRQPDEVAALIGAFASRVLRCHELVPWKSENDNVFGHFRNSVEAEDGHLAVLDLLAGLVGRK